MRSRLACAGAVADARSLWVYRGLVINYDAHAGLTHQPIHRDGALISCVVPLSTRDEYEYAPPHANQPTSPPEAPPTTDGR